MQRPAPTIAKYMTLSPHTIGAERTLAQAQEVMQAHGLRNLPVLREGKLVGMVTDRDVRLLESMEDVDPKLITISDAMEPQVYTCAPDARLDEVALQMGTRKCSAAVVMQGSDVVGIFTTVDACLALTDLLRSVA